MEKIITLAACIAVASAINVAGKARGGLSGTVGPNGKQTQAGKDAQASA